MQVAAATEIQMGYKEKKLTPWEWLSHGDGCLEMMWYLHVWRYSKLDQTRP